IRAAAFRSPGTLAAPWKTARRPDKTRAGCVKGRAAANVFVRLHKNESTDLLDMDMRHKNFKKSPP
ncbi:hypothetical protein, partial [Anaerotruncus massiliensis (ex Togo et al. 2019)]|uniref:hypothetical protein n=1 Tax=Anaerotruncus massiliensis (ex Togo et al. 2019) TaxID=1673720 RepID=UPI0023F8AA6C